MHIGPANYCRCVDDWFKLNTYGSSNKDCRIAGCGGLTRDCDGNWQCGFTKSTVYCNAYVAELCCINEGLMLAKAKGCTQVMVENDSAHILVVLQKDKLGRSDGWCLVGKIRKEMKETGWRI